MVATHMQWLSNGVTFTMDFDAVESESPTHAVQITQYPIELGAKLTDFVRPEPVILKLSTFISNAPARTGLSHMDGMQASDRLSIRVRQPVINTPVSAQLPTSVAGVQLTRDVTVLAVVRTWLPEGQKVQRVERVYEELKRAMYEAREFTVVSELLGDFDRMLVKSLATTRDGKSGNAMRLDIELQQVAYGQLFARDVGKLLPKKPKKKQSEPAVNVGKQTPTEPADPAVKRSAAKQLGDVIFKRFAE